MILFSLLYLVDSLSCANSKSSTLRKSKKPTSSQEALWSTLEGSPAAALLDGQGHVHDASLKEDESTWDAVHQSTTSMVMPQLPKMMESLHHFELRKVQSEDLLESLANPIQKNMDAPIERPLAEEITLKHVEPLSKDSHEHSSTKLEIPTLKHVSPKQDIPPQEVPSLVETPCLKRVTPGVPYTPSSGTTASATEDTKISLRPVPQNSPVLIPSATFEMPHLRKVDKSPMSIGKTSKQDNTNILNHIKLKKVNFPSAPSTNEEKSSAKEELPENPFGLIKLKRASDNSNIIILQDGSSANIQDDKPLAPWLQEVRLKKTL